MQRCWLNSGPAGGLQGFWRAKDLLHQNGLPEKGRIMPQVMQTGEQGRHWPTPGRGCRWLQGRRHIGDGRHRFRHCRRRRCLRHPTPWCMRLTLGLWLRLPNWRPCDRSGRLPRTRGLLELFPCLAEFVPGRRGGNGRRHWGLILPSLPPPSLVAQALLLGIHRDVALVRLTAELAVLPQPFDEASDHKDGDDRHLKGIEITGRYQRGAHDGVRRQRSYFVPGVSPAILLRMSVSASTFLYLA